MKNTLGDLNNHLFVNILIGLHIYTIFLLSLNTESNILIICILKKVHRSCSIRFIIGIISYKQFICH